jgi:hypothetical protein
MKAVINSIVFTVALLWTVNALGQGTCQNDGGYPNQGGYTDVGSQGYPYGQADPYGVGTGANYQVQTPAPLPYLVPQTAPPTQAAPQGPTARITVVSDNPSAGMATASTKPSAKLTIVADEPDAIDPKIAGLVGTWKAVARQGDGELTTVELHMDNRGWAELTVPGADGKPSTSKSRVNLNNDELKLTDSDRVVSLGKLVDLNARQMVLERADGQVTFVRL